MQKTRKQISVLKWNWYKVYYIILEELRLNRVSLCLFETNWKAFNGSHVCPISELRFAYLMEIKEQVIRGGGIVEGEEWLGPRFWIWLLINPCLPNDTLFYNLNNFFNCSLSLRRLNWTILIYKFSNQCQFNLQVPLVGF